jgi:hypothetical protein
MRRWALALALAAWSRPGLAEVQAPPPAPSQPDVRVAAQIESARGRVTGAFQNTLAGVRADLLFSARVSLGGYVGYANLKGKDRRAHALLGYAQLEYLAPLSPHFYNLRVPLRFATGYLGRNGPVVRASTGLAIALSPKLDLVAEVLTPMVWVTNDQTLLSMNLALELCARF